MRGEIQKEVYCAAANRYDLFNYKPIVLSYHRFCFEESDYPFSRTYEQFKHDLSKKAFDIITIDDGHASIVHACAIMKEYNVRAKLFIATSLIDTPGYCTWEDLKRLSRSHDIENHSHDHINLKQLDPPAVGLNIIKASDLILEHIGKAPRFFVPPFNQRNDFIDKVAADLGLILIHDRITIKNDSK